MEKLNGKKKLIVSVFISGRGTNLNSLINFSKRKDSPIKICLVITNNVEVYNRLIYLSHLKAFFVFL